MKGAALLVLALLAPAAWAQEPSVAAILGSYAAAESHCDSGTMTMRFEPAHGFQPTPFERCAHRDGRHERIHEAWPRNSERIWVRRADGAITRYEGLRDGAVLRYVDFATRRVGAPLTEADLSHRVALGSKVSLRNNPAVFLALLFAAALAGAALGLAAGCWLLASRPRERVLHWRRRAWVWQLRALAAVAILLLGLALLTSIGPDKGHPPAIVFVFVLATWAAVAFGLLAAITLAGYLVQPLVRRRGP